MIWTRLVLPTAAMPLAAAGAPARLCKGSYGRRRFAPSGKRGIGAGDRCGNPECKTSRSERGQDGHKSRGGASSHLPILSCCLTSLALPLRIKKASAAVATEALANASLVPAGYPWQVAAAAKPHCIDTHRLKIAASAGICREVEVIAHD